MARHRCCTSLYPSPMAFLPLLALVLVLAPALLPSPAAAAGYTFPFVCNVSTTLAPDSPGSALDAGAPKCPVCCKQPLNLTFAGAPAESFRRVTDPDVCIALCSSHAYYAITQGKVCQCFDSCSEDEQAAAAEQLPTLLALGNVTACLTPCFPATAAEPWCDCPSHSKCIPGPRGSGMYRCCCEPLFSNPTRLPDNSSVCMPFALGSNLYGVENLAYVNEESQLQQ